MGPGHAVASTGSKHSPQPLPAVHDDKQGESGTKGGNGGGGGGVGAGGGVGDAGGGLGGSGTDEAQRA